MSSYRGLRLCLLAAALCSAAPLYAEEVADPMRPPLEAGEQTTVKAKESQGKTTKESGYNLSSIRIAREQRSATINGKRVGVGDRVGRARVISIRSSSVTLKDDKGKMHTISLLPQSIKTPVEAKQP